ncbi:retrotransposon protein [Hordeum vulgare]|nr:retrotransposon protein [Hordeum vulgare]
MMPSWEHADMLNAAYNNAGFPSNHALEWFLDSGASSHVTGNSGILSKSSSSLKHAPSSIFVGNRHHLPITGTGSTTLFPHDFGLTNILVSPQVDTSLSLYIGSVTSMAYVSISSGSTLSLAST